MVILKHNVKMACRSATPKQYLYGRKCPTPSSCGTVEALFRIELLDRLPEWLSKKATVLGCMSSDAILLEGDLSE